MVVKTESSINFYTSTMAKGQVGGTALGYTNRMMITSDNVGIGENLHISSNVVSRLTIRGADKIPTYTTSNNSWGNAFSSDNGYGQIRIMSNTQSSAHLNIGYNTTDFGQIDSNLDLLKSGAEIRGAGYLQCQYDFVNTTLYLYNQLAEKLF